MLKRMRGLGRVALLGVALLASFHAVHAQAPLPPLNGIAHIAVRVSNLDASRTFYKKLGFGEPFALSRNGEVYEAFVKINDRQFIELYPATAKETQIGFLHLCFEGVDLNAINADYASRDMNPISVRKAGAGNLLFTMQGPEQQNIEYTQYMPGSMHTGNIGKDLGPDRVADKMISVSLAMHDMEDARDYYLHRLLFIPVTHKPWTFNLPGPSGQQVEIVSDKLGHRSRITLETPSMRKSRKHLKAEGIKIKRIDGMPGVVDPDGNIILLKSR